MLLAAQERYLYFNLPENCQKREFSVSEPRAQPSSWRIVEATVFGRRAADPGADQDLGPP